MLSIHMPQAWAGAKIMLPDFFPKRSARFNENVGRNLQGFAFLLGIAIPVSTALQNITILLTPFLVLLVPSLREKLRDAWRMPVGRAALIFFALIVLGCTWSIATMPDRLNTVIKMRWLILLPFLIAFFSSRHLALPGALGFVSGVVISALLSIFFAAMGWVVMAASQGDWSVFRTHSYHNYFIALTVYGLSFAFVRSDLTRGWACFIILSILVLLLDAFFLVQGRSGQIVILALLGFFALKKFHWRGFVIVSVALLFAYPLLKHFPNFESGIERGRQDIARYQKGDTETSIGLRLEFYKNSLQLIKHSPWIGYGTGAFPQAYRELTGFTAGERAAVNPHNDYLGVMVELGLLGLIALLALLFAALWQAREFLATQRWLMRGLIFSMAVATLANSFFTDNITSSGFIVLLGIVLSKFKYE